MIGVLALQGDYEKHIQILDQLDMASTEVRYPEQLDSIEGLIQHDDFHLFSEAVFQT